MKETEPVRDDQVIRDIHGISGKTRTKTWMFFVWRIPKCGAVSFESLFFFTIPAVM